MLSEELERKVAELRKKPLKVFCEKPNGRTAIMTITECVRSGSRYISLAEDEIDDLLSGYLEERPFYED